MENDSVQVLPDVDDEIAIANFRRDVITDAIFEIKHQLNDTDRYWKGMQKSIKILERMLEG